MSDALFIMTTVVFFISMVVYAAGDERLWSPMGAEYLSGLVLTVLLTVYLVYALVRPERF